MLEGLQRVAALPALREDPSVVIYSHHAEARVALEQGEFERADHVFSSALRLSREWQYDIWEVVMTAWAGRAAMFCGRLDDAVRLLERARQLAPRFPIGQAGWAVWRSEAYARAGRVADARAAAAEALACAEGRGERPAEASALRALAEFYAHAGGASEAQVNGRYDHALTLATELGMRPLVAHCHLGLGKFYRRTDKAQKAREHLTTATTMYREMDMRFYLEQAEAEMRALG